MLWSAPQLGSTFEVVPYLLAQKCIWHLYPAKKTTRVVDYRTKPVETISHLAAAPFNPSGWPFTLETALAAEFRLEITCSI